MDKDLQIIIFGMKVSHADVTLGLIRKDEQKILKVISQPNRKYGIHDDVFRRKSLSEVDAADKAQQQEDDEVGPNVYYVPLMWAIDLVNQAHSESRVKDAHAKTLITVCDL